MLSRYSFHVVFIVTLFTAALITTYYTYRHSLSLKVESLEKDEVARVKQRMHELQGTINDLIRKGEYDSIQLEISRLASDPAMEHIYIVTKDLSIAYSTDFADLGKSTSELDSAYLRPYIDAYENSRFGFTYLDRGHNNAHIDSAYPLADIEKYSAGKEELSSVLLLSTFDLSKKEEFLVYETQEALLFSSSGYLLLVCFVIFVLYFNVRARTKKIINVTKSYAQGNYNERIALKGNDELRKIADSVDDMAHHIQEQYNSLKLSEQRAQQYLDIAKVFIAVVDVNGKITLINKEAMSIIGKDECDPFHNQFIDLLSFSKEKEQMLKIQEELLNGTYTNNRYHEFSIGDEEDKRHILSWSFASIIEKHEIVGYLVSGIDISKLKEANDALYQLAHYDSLTQLTNRRYLLQKLDGILNGLRNNESVILLFIDLDRFKVINDTMGHHIGDELLQVISSRLKNILKEEDIIARLGGDEFVVLITNNISKEELKMVINRILTNLSKTMILNGNPISTTASIGVAIAPEHTDKADKLLQYADIAMYEAKSRGKNTYAFYESYDENDMLERLSLQNDLRSALSRGEIVMHYQAQYNCMTNQAIGYEALVRWKHPEKGFIRPDIFIPIAEESGLMLELGEYILKQSCVEFKEFSKKSVSKLVLAVNISVIQFNDKGFIHSLKEAIELSGISHDELELEITEGILLDNIEHKIKLLDEIRAMGVSVSIDDFGTGYSSLSYLKKLPISKLKIDQSFVRDIMTDKDDKAIVKMIIAMAESLGMKVIAEGVETKEQVDFLSKNGCVNIQGYYYAKPFPIESL